MCGYFFRTHAKSYNSSFVYTDPVGLQGVEKINIFVLGVIAASNSLPVILKSLSMPAVITTGVPSATLTISTYETQYGAGTITSSPGPTRLNTTFAIDCFAPVDTTI